jgi:hypothetical protein
MKKSLLAILFLVAGVASAAEVGIYGLYGKGTNGYSEDALGVSVGDHFGKIDPSLAKVGGQLTFDRSTSNVTNLNRYTATVSYDVYKIGDVQTNVRAGVAYLQPQTLKASNGGAGLIGFGVAYPVVKDINLVADYSYQKGNNITKNYNGNIFTVGAKYSF